MCHKELLQSIRGAIDLCFDYGLTPYKDGNQWCVLYGENIQDGIVGFGDTRLDAMLDFKKEYDSYVKRTHLYPAKEQPISEDLEEEIERRYDQAKWGYVDGFGSVCMDKEQFTRIARHFYELGCRHTAVMYDDIEYNRQRAEEAELSEGLDAEMDKYFESMEVQEHENIFEDTYHKIARHFAEWGAEHAK